jgi:ubiquitin-conjugating enzyme (huntingtin interacting protein 2)
MLILRPEEFKHVAREWAIRYAKAPRPEPGSGKGGASNSTEDGESAAKKQKIEDKEEKKRQEQKKREAYRGYNKNMIDKFTQMGFGIETVVDAFEDVGIDKADGEEYELEEEYIGDVTARLFNEI